MSVPSGTPKIGVQTPTVSVSPTLPQEGVVVRQLHPIGEAVPPQQAPIDRFLIGSPGEVEDFATVRDSALFRYRQQNGWQLALQELERAARMPGGQNDWKIHYWIAKIANDHQDIVRAFSGAIRAVELAKKPDEIEKSKQILDYLNKSFSPVLLIPDPNQKGVGHGYIVLVDEGGLIETNKKKVFDALRKELATKGVRLPFLLYLPFGTYRINGQQLEVKKPTEEPEAVKAKKVEKHVFLLESSPDPEKFTFDFWPKSLTPGRGAGGLFLEFQRSGSEGENGN